MKFIASAFLLAAFVVAASAQNPGKILNQAEKAMGGSKALQSIQSVAKTGRITRAGDGASGHYIFRTSQPNLYNVEFDLGGFEIETGSNGRSGWMRNSRDGLQTFTGDASNYFQAEAAFRNKLWFNAKNEKSKIASGGTANIDGKAANVVILTTMKGVLFKLYFDPATGLLIRDEAPATDGTIITDYSDHRVVNGVKQAFQTRVKIGDQIYDIRLEDVKINQQIAKSEFDFPNLSGQTLPDIPSLLKELQANEDKVDEMLETYSYVQKVTQREIAKDGMLREKESSTYQMSFYKGNRMRRLIELNGKPLTAKQQESEDKAAAKRLEEIEKKIAKEAAKSETQSENDRRISFAEILRASNLRNPRRERFRGRDVIVFDFEPNPAYDLKNARTMVRVFGKTAGVMWIDEKDKQIARIEAVLADNFNIAGGLLVKMKKGASFVIDKERINDEVWLPSQSDMNLSLKVFLLKGIDLNQVVKAYDYRKFVTEVKDANVGDTKKP